MTINNSEFVHEHSHSCISRFDGLSKIDELVMEARKMGFPALAITDHGNVGGIIKFYQECKKKKDKKDREIPYPTIKPILGIETYLCRDLKSRGMKEQTDGKKGNRHLVLTAKNQQGYENLCALSQLAFLEGEAFGSARIDLPTLAKHSDGLMCSSACLSSIINSNLLMGRDAEAEKAARIFLDIFGKGNFWLEVMWHGLDSQAYILPKIFALGKKLNIPIIATNDVHCVKKSQTNSQAVLMAISQQKCIKDPKCLKHTYGEFYLKSAEEMWKIWHHHPEVMSNTLVYAEQIEDFLKLGGMRLPKFDIGSAVMSVNWDSKAVEDLKQYFGDSEIENIVKHAELRSEEIQKMIPEGLTPYEFLKVLAQQGMRKLGWDKSDEHIKRLNIELEDINVAQVNNGYDFATYFLIVWDYINFARSKNILTGAGRGSCFSSILLRAIGVCYGPDPIKYSLLWERFLGFSSNRYLESTDFFGKETITENFITTDTENTYDDFVDEEIEEDVSGASRY